MINKKLEGFVKENGPKFKVVIESVEEFPNAYGGTSYQNFQEEWLDGARCFKKTEDGCTFKRKCPVSNVDLEFRLTGIKAIKDFIEKQLKDLISRTLPNPSKFRFLKECLSCYIQDVHLSIYLIDEGFRYTTTISDSRLSGMLYGGICFSLSELEDDLKAVKSRLETRGFIPTKAEQKRQEIEAGLKKFNRTKSWYQHWLGLSYTDGVKYLADKADCHWLIYTIASYQTRDFLEDTEIQKFQIWRLEVEGNSGVLVCERDTDDDEVEVVRQEIPNPDFPLPKVELFLVEKALMLPREYQ